MTTPRRVPIDFHAIANATGVRRGRIVHSPLLGWVIADAVMADPAEEPPHAILIDPPPLQPGETELRIAGGCWCFYGPTKQEVTTWATNR